MSTTAVFTNIICSNRSANNSIGITRDVDIYIPSSIYLSSFVVLGYLDVYIDHTFGLESKLCLAPFLSMLVYQYKSLDAARLAYTFWHLMFLILNENRNLLTHD